METRNIIIQTPTLDHVGYVEGSTFSIFFKCGFYINGQHYILGVMFSQSCRPRMTRLDLEQIEKT